MDTLPEMKSTVLVSNFAFDIDLFLRYSTFSKLKRIISYCYRFYNNSRCVIGLRRHGPITISDFARAEYVIIAIL